MNIQEEPRRAGQQRKREQMINGNLSLLPTQKIKERIYDSIGTPSRERARGARTKHWKITPPTSSLGTGFTVAAAGLQPDPVSAEV